MSTAINPTNAKKAFLIHKKDLPLHCPTAEVALWSAYPRIFLPIEKTGKEVCPYCGTCFELVKEK